MSERKLAHVEKIIAINPIQGADRIVVVDVLGWHCVVKKDECKVGDLVAYLECDCILPPIKYFEFMEPRKYRVKTIKLRQQISQGLIIPLRKCVDEEERKTFGGEGEFFVFPKDLVEQCGIKPNRVLYEGDDVTDLLKIKKYLSPSERDADWTGTPKKKHGWFVRFMTRFSWYRKLFHKRSKSFPEWISKTDEPRLQNMPSVLRDEGNDWYITEKLDGCFHYRMPVTTDSGSIQIGILVNQRKKFKVATFNESTGDIEFKRILEYHKISTKDKRLMKIYVSVRGHGNRPIHIICTDNHEVFTQRGWVEAKNLKRSDLVHCRNSNISYETSQVLLGCLLGDSNVSGNKRSDFYKTVAFSHSIKQEEYFKYKKKIFGTQFIEQKNALSGYGSIMKRGLLKSNNSTKKLIEDYILVNNNKIVNEKWVKSIGPIALAFWYMDDGTLNNRDEKLQRARVSLATNGYTLEECLLLKDMLFNKFCIESTIGDKDIYKGYQLNLTTKGSEIFLAVVAPYICKSMKYKLTMKYDQDPCIWEDKALQLKDTILETNILDIKYLTDKDKNDDYYSNFYDLTLEDNSNYFVNNILVHNCSATYWYKKKWYGSEFGICSRTVRKFEADNSNWSKVARQFELKKKLKSYGELAIQGEIIGPRIQGNKYQVGDFDFYVFNVFDIKEGKYLSWPVIMTIADRLGLKTVPLLAMNISLVGETVDSMIEKSKGKSVLKDVMREGVVYRKLDQSKSFKCINPEFLLKHEGEDYHEDRN